MESGAGSMVSFLDKSFTGTSVLSSGRKCIGQAMDAPSSANFHDVSWYSEHPLRTMAEVTFTGFSVFLLGCFIYRRTH
eukprot:scaffold153_cov347-Pavlova_lutheri.AAC.18